MHKPYSSLVKTVHGLCSLEAERFHEDMYNKSKIEWLVLRHFLSNFVFA
jgi:hypothetical protein